VGSFLNVVVWRVPRKESVVRPGSRCPSCATPIAPRDNVPVVSFLLLRGRCRHCGARIALRYPLVELGTAALFAVLGARFADSWALPAYLVLGAALVAVSAIDLEHSIIPNRIVYPVGFALVPLFAVAAALDDDWGSFARALAAGAVAFALMFAVHVASPRGMGFGDVRLSFLLGLGLGYLGWGEVALGFFLGFLAGSVVGIGLVATGRRTRKQHVPFGPFLAVGTVAALLAGAPLLDAYRDLGAG
jgi:leader peptidase (prepilin peptidase)/N-methyltransferase